jgi:uncharacterized protein
MSILLASLLAAAAAAPATTEAPSFDCVRAATQVETMICSDAGLAMADRAMAYFYAHRRRSSAPLQPHAQWLAERDACADVGCIREAYEGHLIDLGMENDLPRPYQTQDGEGSLDLESLGGGWYAFYAQSIHSYRDAMGPNAADDEAAGAIRIEGDRGVWQGTDGCAISLTRRPRGWQVEQNDRCAGPLYASINGYYRR